VTFEDVLDQALAMLQRRGRVTYRTLKRQFQLDDDTLETLKEEILYSQPQAVDDAGYGPQSLLPVRYCLRTHRGPQRPNAANSP
jgi:hypothetical protein